MSGIEMACFVKAFDIGPYTRECSILSCDYSQIKSRLVERILKIYH